MSDHDKGLYEKYYVARLNDDVGKHNECDYFVLDLVHDKHARMALVAYATSCAEEFPFLARDLLERCGYGNGDAVDGFGS